MGHLLMFSSDDFATVQFVQFPPTGAGEGWFLSEEGRRKKDSRKHWDEVGMAHQMG